MSLEARTRTDHGASLLSRPSPYPWMDEAACRDVDLRVFFANDVYHRKGRPTVTEMSADAPAKAICARCPVLADCRFWNDRIEDGATSGIYGVFGGESPGERARRRRVERAAGEGQVG